MTLRFNDEQLGRTRRILRAGPICDECLGRSFAKVGRGFANAERGRALREAVGEEKRAGRCWVCDGLFAKVAGWADRALRASEGVEFATYLFGVRPSARLEEAEAMYRDRFQSDEAEPLRHAFNRAVGKAFEASLARPATVEFAGPDASFVIDLASETLTLHLASVYVYGRYRKLTRGMPQTRWPCGKCRGRGCPCCGFTGKQYAESVEEWIAAPFLEAACAEGAHLHGAGREDIDARMLGEGRPFVLELVSPRRRTLDLASLRDAVNARARGKVEVSPLSVTGRAEVARIKEGRAAKSYRALIEFERPVDTERLGAAVVSLCGVIEQRTPRRVAHRRADRVRRRRLLAASAAIAGPACAMVEFEAEGGLYIKELVSGDDGRTVPSLSARLGMSASVVALDVLAVGSGVAPEGTKAMDGGGSLP